MRSRPHSGARLTPSLLSPSPALLQVPLEGPHVAGHPEADSWVPGSSRITVKISAATERFKMVDSLNNSVACGLVTLGHEMPGFEILLLVRHGSPKLYLSHLPTQ